MLALKAGPFWNCYCSVNNSERLYNLERKGRNSFEIAGTVKSWNIQTEIVLPFRNGAMGLHHELSVDKLT